MPLTDLEGRNLFKVCLLFLIIRKEKFATKFGVFISNLRLSSSFEIFKIPGLRSVCAVLVADACAHL